MARKLLPSQAPTVESALRTGWTFFLSTHFSTLKIPTSDLPTKLSELPRKPMCSIIPRIPCFLFMFVGLVRHLRLYLLNKADVLSSLRPYG